MSSSILVGDIGSTKSTWWVDRNGHQVFHLKGYNPVFHNETAADDLFAELKSQVTREGISTVWYYGTGIIDDHFSSQIRLRLDTIFPQTRIHVSSDLLGAARSACGNAAGHVIILGTGSHAAVFDGRQITRQAQSLGYILGDEGGGCDIGKCLLRHYFYGDMPSDLAEIMKRHYGGNRIAFLDDLRKSASPNEFLASFARVAVAYKDHPWILELVNQRISLFLHRHLFPLTPTGEIHIIGSIGCIFAGLIEKQLAVRGLSMGQCIQDPARRLFQFHLHHDRT